ncbi:MAG: NUDIX hydrolase [Candidatus Levybacteria bacterium]|nr:NUDIX hydrolase [Candidatus Levybacteria bacterium]
MNRFGPEREQPRPLEARPIQAVAAIIVDPDGLIYTNIEKRGNSLYGKLPGMTALPMETIETATGETREDAMKRLVREEVAFNLVLTAPSEIGMFGVGIAAVTLYHMRVIAKNGRNPNFDTAELEDPKFRNPVKLTNGSVWVREGVPEMVADFQSGARGVYRMSCQPPTTE